MLTNRTFSRSLLTKIKIKSNARKIKRFFVKKTYYKKKNISKIKK